MKCVNYITVAQDRVSSWGLPLVLNGMLSWSFRCLHANNRVTPSNDMQRAPYKYSRIHYSC